MKLKFLITVISLQVVCLLGIVASRELRLAEGKVILLETQPVDPRDLLRGDYVVLNYKISDIPLKLFAVAPPKTIPDRTTIYVVLEQRGEFFEAVNASTTPVQASTNQVVLKGVSRYTWNSQIQVHVNYGLEHFYVAEGTGNPRGKLTVQVSVPASGKGLIKQVFIDGKPYAEVMRKQH